MATSDPIADFLTRIRNALMALHRYVDMPWSKMRQNIAEILKEQGFIENYLVKIEGDGKRGTIRIFLKYTSARKPVIQELKRISKPGLRKYVSCQEIPFFHGNLGLAVISTSRGVLSGNKARELGVGGELICTIK